MKINELRTKNAGELKEIILSSKKELFNLRMQAATGEQAASGRFKAAKKTVARAKTLLNETATGGKSAAPKKSAAKPAAKKAKKG